MARRGERGASLTYFADVNQDEVTRHAELGLGAIVDRRVINALLEVSVDVDFLRDALPD